MSIDPRARDLARSATALERIADAMEERNAMVVEEEPAEPRLLAFLGANEPEEKDDG